MGDDGYRISSIVRNPELLDLCLEFLNHELLGLSLMSTILLLGCLESRLHFSHFLLPELQLSLLFRHSAFIFFLKFSYFVMKPLRLLRVLIRKHLVGRKRALIL
ncbi:hypothetical protein PsorP6_006631 [Peronosclerospora sorghi]|uniref:Uncharacterized protein n=1 Tax=Peronosclerospora sorghi TaxID=230839 RepID=A0ACC0W480_9STRA|nr:hypothetical protein PsorP6_006631 [Peronosclerospora sorghi]